MARKTSNSSEEEELKVVIDNGSYRIKAGIAGEDEPRIIFSTIVGEPMYEGQSIGTHGRSKKMVGGAALSAIQISAIDLTRPIERGVVTNWDNMEKIWRNAFYKIHVEETQDIPVVVSEPPLNPISNKEKMVQVMFEKFGSSSMYIACSSVLGMLASGRTTVVVLDSGYDLSHVLCVYNGIVIPSSVFRSEIGGNDVTNYLIELLGKQGYTFTTAKEREDVNCLKEKHAFVSIDSKQKSSEKTQTTFTLHNACAITAGNVLFQCVEAMFAPELAGIKALGIHELIINSIRSCPSDIWKDLCFNIVLTGCNTLYPGLAERIKKEINSAMPFMPHPIKVIVPPEEDFFNWIGGSIVGSMNTMYYDVKWMTKEDYEEHGPNIVHKSCYNFQ